MLLLLVEVVGDGVAVTCAGFILNQLKTKVTEWRTGVFDSILLHFRRCGGFVPSLHPVLQNTVLKNRNRSPITLFI
jgi:hypothetical protein